MAVPSRPRVVAGVASQPTTSHRGASATRGRLGEPSLPRLATAIEFQHCDCVTRITPRPAPRRAASAPHPPSPDPPPAPRASRVRPTSPVAGSPSSGPRSAGCSCAPPPPAAPICGRRRATSHTASPRDPSPCRMGVSPAPTSRRRCGRGASWVSQRRVDSLRIRRGRARRAGRSGWASSWGGGYSASPRGIPSPQPAPLVASRHLCHAPRAFPTTP